ncbi:MAG TPA: hypothetical protein VNO70_12885 [Blastocatellia bacterium]|nr:hypothetical protein [Blastocatellia bacterium]
MRTVTTLTLLGALFLAGCNGNKNNANLTANTNGNNNTSPIVQPPAPIKPTSVVDPNFKPCNPYFPLVPGSQYKYTINHSSGLVSDVTVVVDEAKENGQQVFIETTQIVDKSGGMELAQTATRKYICDNGRVQLVSDFTDNKVEGKPNTAELKLRTPAVFMETPASLEKTGSKWSYTFNVVLQQPGQPPATLPESTMAAFDVRGTESVKVPAGEFKAVKLGRKVGKSEGVDYYVRGLGLVKRESGEGTNWVLKEYSGVRPGE